MCQIKQSHIYNIQESLLQAESTLSSMQRCYLVTACSTTTTARSTIRSSLPLEISSTYVCHGASSTNDASFHNGVLVAIQLLDNSWVRRRHWSWEKVFSSISKHEFSHWKFSPRRRLPDCGSGASLKHRGST
jgi:hypothetical protein